MIRAAFGLTSVSERVLDGNVPFVGFALTLRHRRSDETRDVSSVAPEEAHVCTVLVRHSFGHDAFGIECVHVSLLQVQLFSIPSQQGITIYSEASADCRN